MVLLNQQYQLRNGCFVVSFGACCCCWFVVGVVGIVGVGCWCCWLAIAQQQLVIGVVGGGGGVVYCFVGRLALFLCYVGWLWLLVSFVVCLFVGCSQGCLQFVLDRAKGNFKKNVIGVCCCFCCCCCWCWVCCCLCCCCWCWFCKQSAPVLFNGQRQRQ
ncbi:unnamed protein product [Polarella glacialis]|uniref:Uncharacterized protein n=1 Tax=Polarella glacialis TaxID=89957 RepID=A0A813J0Y4_POLGL|nr:unnamed protein product [Polarella glacialis]